MTTVSRYGQGSRQAYGLMANLSVKSPVSVSAAPAQGNAIQAPAANVQQKNPKLYKTELCRSWMDHGRCNYGERCQYAHGEHEKRPIPRHPKYKTAYCQSYHQSGYCPYGPRCHFIHNEDSATLSRNTPTINSSFVPQPNNNSLLLSLGGPLHHSCGSAGESPVPSSAGSGSDSPLGSTSPSLDLDESNIALSANNWNVFADNSFNAKRSHFEWPVTMGDVGAVASQKAPLQATTSLCSQPTYDPNSTSLLINDFFAWNFEDKPIGKASSETTVNTVRLPVFAQFSNPNSTA